MTQSVTWRDQPISAVQSVKSISKIPLLGHVIPWTVSKSFVDFCKDGMEDVTSLYKMKLNESVFRPHLCTHRLNWARRTSWGWWNDWDDTVLQTQNPKFEPWRSEAEHATSRSRRLPTILTFTRGWGRNIFVSFKPLRPGTEPRSLAWKTAVLTTTLGPPPDVPIQAKLLIHNNHEGLIQCWFNGGPASNN